MKSSGPNVKPNEETLIPISSTKKATITSSVVDSTLSSTSSIAKILPTGILFVFQALSNLLLINSQECKTSDKYLVGVIVGILGIACFFFSLVDTFTDASTGKVHYGIATINGLATGNGIKPSNLSEYKIKPKDFVYAAMAVLVFCVIALTDQNVVHCLYPSEEENIQKVYQALLVALGALSGVIAVKLPSKRQGITSPVTTR
ncbi:hypothetical protein SUGI_0888020 [Cryptomeria japonica]|uniref:protein DMP6-like n=1 Tax=Cryptomeria japonica TaxID=3369 RepID=UPI00241468F6|nr:protein DMP6-like [Cryptomeria japonica]GLJ42840.1 hypothetical protein SUGI_0888020 [Cryptomeria japonica]